VSRFNPAIVDVLAHETMLTSELWQWLGGEAQALVDGATLIEVADSSQVRELDVQRLQSAPRPMARLAVWRAMNEMDGGRSVTFLHVDRALQLLDVDSGSLDGPGQRVQRIGTRLVLTRSVDHDPEPGDRRRRGHPQSGVQPFEYRLAVPGSVDIPDAR